MSTEASKAIVAFRAENFPHECNIVEEYGSIWLEKLNDVELDWVYLDGDHRYDAVLRDLKSISPKLASEGVIMGDDCWIGPNSKVSEVFLALQDFISDNPYQIVALNGSGQWAIVKNEYIFNRI